MSLVQLWQIIVGGRWRIFVCVLASLGGAAYFASQLPKVYEAKARVLLEVINPDMVTGVQLNFRNMEPYIRTQQLLIGGERVALTVIDKLGWATNPAVIAAFTETSGGDGDIRAWAARRIQSETAAYPLEGGGTIEIVYRAPDPVAAGTIVGLIRQSYIETALGLQTEGAARRAARYAELAVGARATLAREEARYAQLQRELGTVATAAGADVEGSRIVKLQREAAAARVARGDEASSLALSAQSSREITALRRRLSSLDDALALSAGRFGPSNPNFLALQASRDLTRSQLDRAMAALRAGYQDDRRDEVADAAYLAERKRLLGQGDALQKLSAGARQVRQARDQLTRLLNNAATTRTLSERTESGLVVLGDVITNPVPVAPKIPVIMTLALLFGLLVGTVAVVLDGLLRREVRGAQDLEFASGVPVIGVVPGGRRQQSRWFTAWGQRWRAARVRAAA